MIPSTRPRSQAAIAASRASLYGNFEKSTDQVTAASPEKKNCTVFVGGLSSTIDSDTLTAAFERFGEVLEVRVIWGKVRPTPLRPIKLLCPPLLCFDAADATPGGTRKKSRWDATPSVSDISAATPVGADAFGATPAGNMAMGMATPTPGQSSMMGGQTPQEQQAQQLKGPRKPSP